MERFLGAFFSWVLWVVILPGLLPIGLLGVAFYFANNQHWPPTQDVLSNGNLLLLSALLLFGSIEALSASKKLRLPAGAVIAGTVILALLGIAAWSDIAVETHRRDATVSSTFTTFKHLGEIPPLAALVHMKELDPKPSAPPIPRLPVALQFGYFGVAVGLVAVSIWAQSGKETSDKEMQ